MFWMFLDELFVVFDFKYSCDIMEWLCGLFDCIILLVLYDLLIVVNYVDWVVVLKDGKVYM